MDGRLMLKTAGEIGVKSPRTRRWFVRVLRKNVRAALERAGIDAQVASGWSRLLVRAQRPDTARQVLSRVFGLHSVAEVTVLHFDGLDDLVRRAADVFRERVIGKTFAVRPKRAGNHDFRSGDIARELGTALLGDSAGVNLDEPEVEVTIEVAGDTAYAVLESVPGAGGLPIGTGGRAVALFSGGFDSPVAAWMALSRGTAVDLVVCDLGGCAQTDAALEVAKELATGWAPGIEPRAHVVDLIPVIALLTQEVEPRLRQILLKRAMYRVGTLIAEAVGADAVVSGESLGQASTQTLRNLAVAEEAAGVAVLRPLVGMSKEEIVQRSRRIGTHDVSVRVHEYCNIATGPVETWANLAEVIEAEAPLDESLIRKAVEGRREVDLVAWERGPLPEYVVEELPEGALVVDVRETDEGESVGELRRPFSRSDEWMPDLDRNRSYVFVCSVGRRSEMVAHELHERGYLAYCLAGGVPRLHQVRS
ncbi:MAG: tRNA uracil 4-sulfurtransferase ThiI [Actinomycetota bacterium]